MKLRAFPRAALSALCVIAAAGCVSERQVVKVAGGDFNVRIEQPQESPEDSFVILTGGPDSFWRVLPPDGDALQFEDALSLAIIDKQTGKPAKQSILCDYAREENRLTLTPQFPLTAGNAYAVEVNRSAASGAASKPLRSITIRFTIPSRPTPERPRIVGVYPSGDVVPANCLKFYIQFSRPMQQGRAFDRIKLFNDGGGEVLEPFRKVELWSPDEKRLTLWLHPGRQKSGVNLNEEFGPILEEGRDYALAISGNWPSADGAALDREYRKAFRAGPAVRRKLDINAWDLKTPAPGTRSPFRIHFPAPLDWALLHNTMSIQSQGGPPFEGVIAIEGNEKTWIFSPRQEWRQETYRLRVDTRLEDLAGNTPAQAFERDILKPTESRQEFLLRRFHIGNPAQ